MVQTKTFSSFSTADLNNSGNLLVGIGGGINIKAAKVTEWTTLTRPASPFDGLIGYNTDLKQWEYWNSSTVSWIQFANNSIVNATYILQTANSLLPNAQILSSLSTGILKSTTATGVLSISPALTSIDSLTSAADQMLYSSGVNTYSLTSLTSLARTFLADTTASAMRSTLGLGTSAVKNVTDNSQTNVTSSKGSFTIGHLLVAADTSGTAIDGGSPFGGGTVTEVDTGTGLTGGPITITGTISFASIAANSLWVNNTAGSAVPTVTSLASLTKTDDTNVTLTLGGTPATSLINSVSLTLGWTGILSPTRGGLGVSNPTAHGILIGEGSSAVTPIVLSSGQILIGSTGIDPVAAAINSGTGILVGNGAGSITVSLSSIADHTLLANISGGSLAPSSTTLTALIDNAIGNTQGNVLYRNATSWVVLAPGTSGFFLTSGGAAANVSWTAQTAPSSAALTKTDDTNVTLTLGGSPNTALLAATSLTLGWTGQLSLARGGTNANLTASNGAIPYSTATAFAFLAPGTSGQLLQSGGAGAPSWTTTTFPSTAGASGNILISNGTNYISSTSLWPNTVGTVGKLLRSNGTSNAYTTSTYPDTNAVSTLLYASSANVMSALATSNSGLLTTDSGGVPSITALSGLGILASLVKTVKVQTFTTPGANTYTPSTGMLYCTLEVQAPGGGGGGVVTSSALQTTISGGGGGGGYARKTVTAATIGGSQTVTIGSVGTAGANTGTNGGTGGTTSVGVIVSSTGGSGGSGLNASGLGANSPGGLGGVGSSGDFNINGGGGFSGLTSAVSATNVPNQNPSGGNSYFSGVNAYLAGFGAGTAGLNYGSGGTGAFSFGNGGGAGAFAGGAGGSGIVIITEYCNQ